jgi:hypothetical protein
MEKDCVLSDIKSEDKETFVISGFRHDAEEIGALMGHFLLGLLDP